MISILCWFFAVVIAFGVCMGWRLVGEPRKPLTDGQVLFNSIVNVVLIALLVYAAVKL